jgi:glycosyltransferase involved in cell wall biosynthesis
VISFVIPAYNEEHLIAGTLSALREAARTAGEPHEILVVDDGSSDRTAAVAQELGAQVVRVNCRQISAARNAGAREARGDLLVFVDADTRVHGALVRAAFEAMRTGAAGGGSAVRFDEPLPAYARLLATLLVALMRSARLAAGCFLFCTREAFEAVGGFDERLYGAEEIVMSQALKRQGRFVVLREYAITSGRKLRAHSGRELLGTLMRLFSGGLRSVESRDRLDLWYRPRREDPAEKPAKSA